MDGERTSGGTDTLVSPDAPAAPAHGEPPAAPSSDAPDATLPNAQRPGVLPATLRCDGPLDAAPSVERRRVGIEPPGRYVAPDGEVLLGKGGLGRVLLVHDR